MKNNNLIIVFLVLMMLFVSGLQVVNVIYSPSKPFDVEISRQLVSIVQIKGERINDYFLERKADVNFLASSSDIEELFNKKMGYNFVIEKNLQRKLKIISRQVVIFLNKYPGMGLEELKENKEFMNLVSQKFSEESGIFLNNNLSLGYVINKSEFKMLREKPIVLDEFVRLGKYADSVLINSDGFVVYGNGVEVGKKVKFASADLNKIYYSAKNKGTIIYGPYMRETKDGFDMVLAFASRVRGGNVIILFDNMNFLNLIINEKSGLGDTGKVYLLDGKSVLISSLNDENRGEMIQEVSTKNSVKCFESQVRNNPIGSKVNSPVDYSEIISLSYGANGNKSIGTYAYIKEPNWCLISEVGYEEVFDLPKRGKIVENIWFIGLFNLFLFGIGIYFVRRYLR